MSTRYAFDFLSTTVAFDCSHPDDSCDNQIGRGRCNQEVIALAAHPLNLGRDLRLRWKESDGFLEWASGHRIKVPDGGAQGPSLQGAANWRRVLPPPGTSTHGRALGAPAL